MLRKPLSPYENGRSLALVKYKVIYICMIVRVCVVMCVRARERAL